MKFPAISSLPVNTMCINAETGDLMRVVSYTDDRFPKLTVVNRSGVESCFNRWSADESVPLIPVDVQRLSNQIVCFQHI